MTDISMNVCNNTAYLNSVDQRTRFQLYNIPPARYDNLANNPYNKINPITKKPYTRFDIDMRRKAEILRYSSNRMSTQTNNLTKAQIYAQAANGNLNKKSYSLDYITANTINGVLTVCPTAPIIQTPTTASDVPGPVILLYDDPSVPLYNLVNDTNRAYGLINQEKNPYTLPWKTENKTNVINTDISYNNVFSLFFFNVSSPAFTFTVSFPISIQFTGEVTGITPVDTPTSNFTISVNKMSLNVLYSYSSVPISPSSKFFYNTILSIDISKNATSFSGFCFFDIVTFSNTTLAGALGYIYDFQFNLKKNIIQNDTYAQYYSTPILTTFLNSTGPTNKTNTNCLISNNPPTNPFPQFSIQSNPIS
jgi:hypothetical protein